MKKIVFTALALTSLLQSCGNKPQTNASSYKNKITLGKFADIVTPSTFDESKLSDLPRSVNLKSDMSIGKNQGSRGSCTFFSTAAMLEAVIKKDMKVDVNLSEEYMNYSTKSQGYYSNDEGSTVLHNIYGISKAGLMLENDSPYQPSWFDKGLPCEKYKADNSSSPEICFSHNKPDADSMKKVIAADSIEFIGMEKDTNEIIRFLAEEKRPLTMGIVVNFAGWDNNGEVYYDETLRAQCLNDRSLCGGHSVLITGYDLDKKIFYIKNSWGKEWGQDGYGTITMNTVDLYASYDFYSAKLTDSLKIPENKIVKSAVVKSMSSTSVRDNEKLSVNLSAEVSGAKGNIIYISSFVVKKQNINDEANDTNVELVALNKDEASVINEQYIRAIRYITDSAADTLLWTNENPITLNFMKGSEQSLKKVLDSAEDKLLRTTIYTHTDIDSWKILKREYHPIAN